MDRSTFLKTGLLGAAGLFARPLFALQPQPKGLFTELRKGAGYFTLRGGTIGYYKDKDVFVMIDSQFADTAPIFAEQFLGESGRKIDLLINTHHHGDHTGGNFAVREKVTKIVAHAKTAEFQKKVAKDPTLIAVADETFETDKKIKIGKETIVLKHFGSAHSAGDTIVHLQKSNVAHMGDLMFNRWPAVIDRSSGANVKHWIVVLEKAHKMFNKETKVIFGHGNEKFGVVGNKAELLVMRDFLTASIDFVDKSLKAGGTKEDIMKTEVLPGFENHIREGRKDAVGRMLGLIWDEQTGVTAG